MKTINSFRSKLAVFMIALVASISTFAYDFQDGYLFYNILEDGTAAVTSEKYGFPYDYLPTALIIPDRVTDYNGKTYIVTEIANYAFGGCDMLESLVIPNTVKKIGMYAFTACTKLVDISFPDSLEDIMGGALYECAWYNNQPDGLIYIGNLLYRYKGTAPAGTIIVKEGTTAILDFTFHNQPNIQSVILPESLTSIHLQAFYGCTNITELILPASIQIIENQAFAYCTSLTEVTCYATIPPVRGDVVSDSPSDWFFEGVDVSKIPLYVPVESIDLYKEAEQWSGFHPILSIQSSYKSQWCDTWNVLELKYRYSSYTTKEDFETWRYYLAQDTLINNYTYTAVTRQTTKVPEGVYPFTIPEPEYVAAVRFTDDRKVYIYYDNTEYLLYDFNVQPGDELTVFAGINHYHSHHTNTIRVDEVFGTEISLSVFPDFSGDERPACFGVTKWVEGVGDLCGFITGADCGLSEYQTALLCAYKDGNTEYTTEYEEYAEYGCEYNSGENKEYILTLPGLQRTVCNEYCGETEEDNSANFTYKQTFDSIFFENDKPYILCNGYLLREEDNKIFLYSQSLNKDIVLYDFTLEVGDSLPAYIKDFDGTMYSDDTLVVTDISSVTLLDGKKYKKWTFDNGMEYVEGIGMYGGRRNGNFFGLIQEVVVPCHIGTHLVCVSKNNKLLYQMDDAEMERLGAECLCEYNSGPKKDNAKNGKIGGRPTPTQWNMLEVETKEMDGTPTILRAETFSYTLENDSLVANNKTFYQLARQSTKDTAITKSFVGALHFGEDEDNRVYFLRDGIEYVLYDFTAEPGDTIEIFAGINNYPQETTYTHVVVDKDTTEDGACRMFLEVVFPDETTTATNAEKVWLAGLGSIDGIVHNAAQRTSDAHAAPSRSASSETQSSVMLCAWREDSCLYTTNHPEYDTFGCVYNQDPTAVENLTSPSSYQKIIHEGTLLILHEGKVYNVIGIQIK